MSKVDKVKLSQADWDLRVRDRNVARGTLDPKAIEKHLAELPDLDAHCETVGERQPALGSGDDED